MEAVDLQKPKRVRKYSTGGLVLGGLFLLSTLGNLLISSRDPKMPVLGFLVTLVPALAILLRSSRPPIGFVRGISLLFGGLMAGQVPMSLQYAASEVLKYNLVVGAIGIFLICVGFKNPKKASM